MAIVLDNNSKIEVLLGGAVTTTELDMTASYADKADTALTPGRNAATTNGTTPQTIVAAPASDTRLVSGLSIYNNDTVAATVTVQMDVSATDYILQKVALAAGDNLTYETGLGWRVLDSSGSIK